MHDTARHLHQQAVPAPRALSPDMHTTDTHLPDYRPLLQESHPFSTPAQPLPSFPNVELTPPNFHVQDTSVPDDQYVRLYEVNGGKQLGQGYIERYLNRGFPGRCSQ